MKYVLDVKKFRSMLRDRGLRSAVELAKESGIHRNTINQYLRGKSVLASSFEKIARVLNVDPLDLVMPIEEPLANINALEEILPLIGLISRHDQSIAVILLGSRARGAMKKHADWDIGITRSSAPIGSIEFLRLRGMVADASEDLIHDVDLINLDAAPKWFLQSIDYEPIFLGGNEQSFIYFKGVLDGAKRDTAA